MAVAGSGGAVDPVGHVAAVQVGASRRVREGQSAVAGNGRDGGCSMRKSQVENTTRTTDYIRSKMINDTLGSACLPTITVAYNNKKPRCEIILPAPFEKKARTSFSSEKTSDVPLGIYSAGKG